MSAQAGSCYDESTLRVGEFLVCIGAMTEKDVERVLADQERRPYKLFGQIAIEMGLINDDAIDRYLEARYPVKSESVR